MNETMRMEVSEVQAAISNFDARGHEFNDAVNTIGSTMLFLASTWTGEAERAFQTQITDLLKNVKTIMDSIEGAKQRLNIAISAYEETESTQQSAINAVEEGASDYVV